MPLDAGSLDAILAVAVAEGAVPGLAVVITDRDGMLYSGTAGTLRAGGNPVDASTMFRYASCTKALASVAALQLVEQGRMSLDDEVATIFPEFGKLQVLDGFDGDTPILRPPARSPLVRELLTHSSGLTYFFTNPEVAKFHAVTGTVDVLSGEKAALTEVPLARDPGIIWDYGTNTDWLGLLVEHVSGQSLDAYFAENILGPLGMTDVTFAPTAEQRDRLMPVYARTPDGGLVETPLELAAEPEWFSGGHGLYGTADAYARFIRAMLRGGELDGARILTEESVALAFSDQLGGVPMPTEGIVSTVPELLNDVPPFPFAESWGLGFHLVLEDVPGARRAGTGDWAGIFNLYYWIDRSSGVGGMILTQVLPFFDAGVVNTSLMIEGTVYAQLGIA
ncbi:serine hydrolase [Sporichthya sp.]|uniref:serine hydrolase domain-containing protein n=1 Tax=Sporichthya sp. TaxID=65475 RepID=UPI0017A077FC|nr:serine hydrolase domain-containing protein [Sporichthya sp.]MBA3744586.1 beta-lactamase family protein [Sporichthya sp.]